MQSKKSISSLIFLIISFLATFSLQATPPSEENLIQPGKSYSGLGENLYYFEDKTATFTIDSVKAEDKKINWQKSNKKILNFGFSTSVYWLKLSLKNSSAKKLRAILEFGQPLIDYLDIFPYCGDKKFEPIFTGDRKPFSNRVLSSRFFELPVEFEAHQECIFYLRMANNDGLHEALQINLFNEKDHYQSTQLFYIIYGLLYGIALVLFIHHLFLYFALKDYSYLSYSLYILFFLIWSFDFNGLGHQYLWPNFPHFGNILLALSSLIFSMAVIVFINLHLNTKENMKIHFQISRVIVYTLTLLAIIPIFFSYSLYFRIFFPLIMFIIPYILFVIIQALIKKNPDALLILYAWLLIGSGGITYGLKFFKILPANFITENGLHIGAFIQFIILAAAMMQRFNRLRKEREKELEKHIEQGRNLEKIVQERTQELRQSNSSLNDLNERLMEMNAALTETRVIMDQDLDMAASVQRNFLTIEDTNFQNWEIATSFLPVASVSGDFYDFYRGGGGYLNGVTLCDVSGHGVSSGLITIAAKSIIFREFFSKKSLSLKKKINSINRKLINEIGQIDKYITGIFLEIKNDTVEYLNAGHPDIILARKNKKVDKIQNIFQEIKGSILGVDGYDVEFDTISFQIDTGECLFIFSDGMIEPFEKKKNLDGYIRLTENIQNLNYENLSATEILDHIMKQYWHELLDYRQEDDITLIVLKKK